MRKNKLVTSVFIIMILVIGIILLFKVSNTNIKLNDRKEILEQFIFNKLMDNNGGIYTNYIDRTTEDEITKGHYILSESQGILMQYALKEKDEELFEKTVNFITENMILENGLISWRVKDEVVEGCSATIDDLRIINSLILGSDIFKNDEYRVLANSISESVYSNLVNNYNLIDFKDIYGKSKNITICYLDLEALNMLKQSKEKWQIIYDNSLKLIKESRVSDEVPLYSKVFNFETNKYDEEDIDTLLSVITIKNLLLAGEDVEDSIQWIRNKLYEDKMLFTKYDRITGENRCNIESTSIYAIVSDIAKIINDDKLYRYSLKNAMKFQILDRNNELYGGFGEVNNSEIYSFDNLNILYSL